MPARIAIIAITTSNSISVKPEWVGRDVFILGLRLWKFRPFRPGRQPFRGGRLTAQAGRNIGDRVVRMAAVIVMEPILETELADEHYGDRLGRSAHDAVAPHIAN